MASNNRNYRVTQTVDYPTAEFVREERRTRKPRAFNLEKDGEYARVEFTNDAGERVIGLYSRYGWARPPAHIAAEVDAALNKPIQTVLYPRARGARVQK